MARLLHVVFLSFKERAFMIAAPFMFLSVDTRDPDAVERRVSQDYWRMYPEGNSSFVPWAFRTVRHYFEGRDAEYLGIDAHYHDLEHTLQGTLAFSGLLRGRVEADVEPRMHQETGELGLLAILLHDTGYLKRRGDSDGTGAKYTITHVNRSCDFAEELLKRHGYTLRQIHSVQHMIRCTGVGVNVANIPFQSEEERIAGFALGTCDLLGQMAARDYVEKLPVLFEEFIESARFNSGRGGGAAAFSSPLDLMRKTPDFWRKYVRPKIDNDFHSVYRFLSRPAPDGPNEYLDAIEANIERLEKKLATLQAAA
jgi:hypothetical protein